MKTILRILPAFAFLFILYQIADARTAVEFNMSSDNGELEYTIDAEGDETEGSITVNGEKIQLNGDDIDVTNTVRIENGASSVSVKSSTDTSSKTEVKTENGSTNIQLEYDAGPSPASDSTIKVTVDGETIVEESDIAPGEKLEVNYSNTEEEQTQEDDQLVVTTTDTDQVENNNEEEKSVVDAIVELIDNLVSFIQQLF